MSLRCCYLGIKLSRLCASTRLFLPIFLEPGRPEVGDSYLQNRLIGRAENWKISEVGKREGEIQDKFLYIDRA